MNQLVCVPVWSLPAGLLVVWGLSAILYTCILYYFVGRRS